MLSPPYRCNRLHVQLKIGVIKAAAALSARITLHPSLYITSAPTDASYTSHAQELCVARKMALAKDTAT
jgi:hypothetical protein